MPRLHLPQASPPASVLPPSPAAVARALPWLWAAAAVLAVLSLTFGLGFAPSDPGEGEAHRIALLHRPALWLSASLYVGMALLGAAGLLMHEGLLFLLASATVPTGALMSFITLWTGALHDRPVSGRWWNGDSWALLAGLLLVLYLVLMAMRVALGDARRADRAGACFTLAGCAALAAVWLMFQAYGPGSQGLDAAGPAIGSPYLSAAQALMAGAFSAYALAACLARARALMLERVIALRQRPPGPGA
jgi:heme exporter protein C